MPRNRGFRFSRNAARPSGTEDVYKIYAESFVGREHLASIQREAKGLIGRVFEKSAS